MHGQIDFCTPTYAHLKRLLRTSLKKNLGQAVRALIFYTFLQSIVISIAFMPALYSLSSDAASLSIFGKLLSILLIAGACLFFMMLQYGLMGMMLQLTLQHTVTTGHMFEGFRDTTGRVFKAALVLLGLFVLLGLVLTLAFYLCMFATNSPLTSIVERFGPIGLVRCTALAFFAITFLAMAPFIFLWLVLHTNDSVSEFTAFFVSARLLKGRFFHCIGFILYSGGIPLVCTIGILPLIGFASESFAEQHSVLFFILNVLLIILQYMVLARLYLSVPVYFCSLVSAPRKTDGTQEMFISSGQDKCSANISIENANTKTSAPGSEKASHGTNAPTLKNESSADTNGSANSCTPGADA